MKTLTIVRHAKSSWDNASLADSERPLNGRGERDAPVMAERIHAAGVRPSLILSSHAVRAWTTAKIIAKELHYPVEFLQREKDMYLASADRLLSIIARQDEGFNHLMIVGHNPGLTDLVNTLVPNTTGNLPTAGVVSIAMETDTWELRGDFPRKLLLYDYPKKKKKP